MFTHHTVVLPGATSITTHHPPSYICHYRLVHRRIRKSVPVPWYGIRIELFCSVVFREKLHSNHSKDVYDNNKYKCEISKSTNCGNDDTKENFHCGPGPRQFQDPQLQQRNILVLSSGMWLGSLADYYTHFGEKNAFSISRTEKYPEDEKFWYGYRRRIDTTRSLNKPIGVRWTVIKNTYRVIKDWK